MIKVFNAIITPAVAASLMVGVLTAGPAVAQEEPVAWMRAELAAVLSNPSDVSKFQVSAREFRAWPDLKVRIDITSAGTGNLAVESFYVQNFGELPVCVRAAVEPEADGPVRAFWAGGPTLIAPKSGDSVVNYSGPPNPTYVGEVEVYYPKEGGC